MQCYKWMSICETVTMKNEKRVNYAINTVAMVIA